MLKYLSIKTEIIKTKMAKFIFLSSNKYKNKSVKNIEIPAIFTKIALAITPGKNIYKTTQNSLSIFLFKSLFDNL